MRRPIALIIATGALVACTGVEDSSPAPRESPPAFEVPVALVTHLGREVGDITVAQAEAVLAGEVDSWDDLGGDAEPATVVTAEVDGVASSLETAQDAEAAVERIAVDMDALAVVPAHAATPRVQVLEVDRVDPLRDREEYALTTATDGPPGTVVTTTIVGDVMLGRRVGEALAASDDPAAVWRPLADRLSAADITVANFESTLSRDGSPTQGGDSFAADPSVLEGLELAGIDLLSLANNHLGDFGPAALDQTVDALIDAGLTTVGGGKDLGQARAPAVIEREGARIGFVATDSIGETPAATADQGGTNRIDAPPRTGPLDQAALDRVSQDIRDLDRTVDIVIVMPHWGTQYTNVPEESQHEMAEAFVGAGADLVVGGHPHWVQGWETIDGVTVVHSLGNFIFDMDFMPEVQQGLFVEVVSWGDRVVDIEPVPYVIDDQHAPHEASAEHAEDILQLVRETSEPPFDVLRLTGPGPASQP